VRTAYPAEARELMLASVRRGLRSLGDLAVGAPQIQIYLVRDGLHSWHDGDWLMWLARCFPEVAREDEPEPYEVPDDLEGPETVPWLTARDISEKTIERWWHDVFTYEHALCSLAALALFREEGDLPGGEQPLTDWARMASRRAQADLWNRVMERLGYTEDA